MRARKYCACSIQLAESHSALDPRFYSRNYLWQRLDLYLVALVYRTLRAQKDNLGETPSGPQILFAKLSTATVGSLAPHPRYALYSLVNLTQRWNPDFIPETIFGNDWIRVSLPWYTVLYVPRKHS